jgi:hypothetical protein
MRDINAVRNVKTPVLAADFALKGYSSIEQEATITVTSTEFYIHYRRLTALLKKQRGFKALTRRRGSQEDGNRKPAGAGDDQWWWSFLVSLYKLIAVTEGTA